MSDLYAEAVEQVLDLYDRRLGDGDVTAESLWPYPRHTRAEVVANDTVPAWCVRLMEAVMKHGDSSLMVSTEETENASYLSRGIVGTLEGNGQAILTGWQVARPLMVMLTMIQRKIQSVVDELKPLRIRVTHNLDLPVGHDRAMRYAVEQGGGVSFATGLDEIVYLSADHIEWAGSAKEALQRVTREVGESRKLIKVAVEITDPDQLSRLENARVDMIYCLHFTADDIRSVKDLTRGWTKLTVDETIPLEEIKTLADSGIRMYMVNINLGSTESADPDLFSVRFSP
ncbi:MAG: hypothetical protein ACE5HZ_04935 [Fidelibacterota bacterium]